jgi:hypothetical protein
MGVADYRDDFAVGVAPPCLPNNWATTGEFLRQLGNHRGIAPTNSSLHSATLTYGLVYLGIFDSLSNLCYTVAWLSQCPVVARNYDWIISNFLRCQLDNPDCLSPISLTLTGLKPR